MHGITRFFFVNIFNLENCISGPVTGINLIFLLFKCVVLKK